MMIPSRLHLLILTFLSIAILTACDQSDTAKPPPQISTQGFDIENVQKGIVGQFGSLRLRIESMARITKLLIKERSYEVDLATTREKNHFQLFGLQKKTMLRTDVTLDFQNYINRKLVQAGEYEFTIEVVDKKDQATRTSLHIIIEEAKGKTTPIETGHFQLQREGKNQVSGSDKFGITWKTIDEIKVTIRISKADNGASKIARFNTEDYNNLNTKEALSQKIISARDVERIEFDTANNAAAQEVVGIANLGKYYLLKTNLSETFLSQIGTTVTLDGEYKF
jgi:hypothetical protein